MIQYIHLQTNIGYALGKALVRAGMKEINESFDAKLYRLKKGDNIFVPLQDIEKFSKYIAKHNIVVVKIQADKKGIVLSLQDKLRRPMP